ncbi:MAG TPA: ferritin-like domain-containing protein [Nitrososphaeraceae archaeon]|jgi:rubrerythrin|nr:ferritin-like domain-containing protein [Nitrososphaeraceae archaeon]
MSLDSNVKQSERKQKLYTLLKAQHGAEVKEIMYYMSVLRNVQNNMIRNYLHTLLNDGLKHIEYISSIMTNIEGATSSSSLTKKGIAESIAEENESRDKLLECIEAADDLETKSLLKSLIVDEEHHIKILENISSLVESYQKRS